MKPIFVVVAIFMASFILLRHTHPEGFLLYQGIVLGFLFSIGLLIWQLTLYGKATFFQAMKDALLAFLIIYAFVFTIPTTVDRSYSVYMINQIAKNSAGLNQKEITQMYIN